MHGPTDRIDYQTGREARTRHHAHSIEGGGGQIHRVHHRSAPAVQRAGGAPDSPFCTASETFDTMSAYMGMGEEWPPPPPPPPPRRSRGRSDHLLSLEGAGGLVDPFEESFGLWAALLLLRELSALRRPAQRGRV
jgi:hypothetical protein